MPAPFVKFTKLDGVTGAVQPGAAGVMAFIACASAATIPANVASTFATQSGALAALGNGPLVDELSYDMATSGNQAVAVVPTTTTAAAYGTITHTGVLGTSVPSAGATAPLDDYAVIVTFPLAGTIGVAGLTFTYSLDGGVTTLGPVPLGTSTTVTLNLPPSAGGGSSGVSFTMGAGTILAGDNFSCFVTHARMTNTDLTSALEALRVTRQGFEGIFVDEEYATGLVSALDTWLAARENEGRFYFAIINTRHKTLPVPTAESETAYATAMQTLIGTDSSIRLVVGADGAQMTSPVTGLFMFRPTGLFIIARAASISIGEDPAWVQRGKLAGSPAIADTSGNPKWHNEAIYPNLEALRLSTLTTLATEQGIFITDALVFSSPTSDYQFLQHIRVMNAACTIAYAALVKVLSKGVGKKKPDPITGAVYISEESATQIEEAVNEALTGSGSELVGQADGFKFTLSRTDNIGANTGAIVHGQVEIASFAYVKGIAVNSSFVTSLAA